MNLAAAVLPARARSATAVRWFVVAVAFTVVSAGTLVLCRDGLGLSTPLAALVAGEMATVMRFVVNETLVFRTLRGAWPVRLWRFHVASAASFALWWAMTVALTAAGMHYVLASFVGNAACLVWGFATSFWWVWADRSAA